MPRELFCCHVGVFEESDEWSESEAALRWAKEHTGRQAGTRCHALRGRTTLFIQYLRCLREKHCKLYLEYTQDAVGAGANDLEASEFLAALLSFGMGVEAAKSFVDERWPEGDVRSFQSNAPSKDPGPIAAGAFRLFSAVELSEHQRRASDTRSGDAAGCST